MKYIEESNYVSVGSLDPIYNAIPKVGAVAGAWYAYTKLAGSGSFKRKALFAAGGAVAGYLLPVVSLAYVGYKTFVKG